MHPECRYPQGAVGTYREFVAFGSMSCYPDFVALYGRVCGEMAMELSNYRVDNISQQICFAVLFFFILREHRATACIAVHTRRQPNTDWRGQLRDEDSVTVEDVAEALSVALGVVYRQLGDHYTTTGRTTKAHRHFQQGEQHTPVIAATPAKPRRQTRKACSLHVCLARRACVRRPRSFALQLSPRTGIARV